MKITSGLGSIDDYPRYVRAGADELFCGLRSVFLVRKIRNGSAAESERGF